MSNDKLLTELPEPGQKALREMRARFQNDALAGLAEKLRAYGRDQNFVKGQVKAQWKKIGQIDGMLSDINDKVSSLSDFMRAQDEFQLSALERQQKINAALVSQLPAAAVLSLVNEGAITLAPGQKQMLERQRWADGMLAFADRASGWLGVAGTIAGNPETRARIRRAAAGIQNAATLAASLAVSNYLGAAQASASLLSTIGIFGGSGADNPDAPVLQAISELSKKIDSYHQDEIARIDSVNANVEKISEKLDEAFAKLNIRIDDLSWIVTFDSLREVSYCTNLAKILNDEEENRFRENDRHRQNARERSFSIDQGSPVRAGLTSEIARDSDNCFSALYSFYNNPVPGVPPQLLIETGHADQSAKSSADLQDFVLSSLLPLGLEASKSGIDTKTLSRLADGVDYDAAAEVLKSNTSQENHFEIFEDGRLLLSGTGGLRLLNRDFVEGLTSFVEEAAKLHPLEKICGNAVYPLTFGDLEEGKRAPNCAPGSLLQAQILVAKHEKALRTVLAQEALIAGIPLLKWAKQILDEGPTALGPRWHDALEHPASSAAASLLSDMTRPALSPVTGRNETSSPKSSCGDNPEAANSDVRSLICLMHANPFFAANVIRYTLYSNMRSKGISPREYEQWLALREFDKVGQLLGGLPVRATYAKETGDKTFFVVSLPLPRAEALKDSSNAAAPLRISRNCWGIDDNKEIQDWWTDNYTSPPQEFTNLNNAFCVVLPTKKEVEIGAFQFRPGYGRLVASLASLLETRAQLELRPDGMVSRQ